MTPLHKMYSRAREGDVLEAFGLGPLVAAAFKAGFVGFVVTTTCHTTIHTCACAHARTHAHAHTRSL